MTNFLNVLIAKKKVLESLEILFYSQSTRLKNSSYDKCDISLMLKFKFKYHQKSGLKLRFAQMHIDLQGTLIFTLEDFPRIFKLWEELRFSVLIVSAPVEDNVLKGSMYGLSTRRLSIS